MITEVTLAPVPTVTVLTLSPVPSSTTASVTFTDLHS